MTILNKLFKKRENNKGTETIAQFLKLFSVNIISLPDKTFFIHKVEEINEGKHFVLYKKILQNKEFGIFNYIEVKVYPEGNNKQISFINNDLTDNDNHLIEKLVNDCYGYYGADDAHISKGIFNEDDILSLANKQWVGRMWIGKHHKPASMLLMNEDRLEFIIWI